MTFEYLGYQVIQDEEDYRSIMLLRDEKEVMHLSVTRLMSEGELIETVDECFKALGKLNTDDYIFGDELFYDGDEPC
jgi:hypothetical protein